MKAYELLQQVKDLALYTTTGRDSQILQRLNLTQFSLYDMEFHWRSLEKTVDLTTTTNSTFTALPLNVGILYDVRQVSVSPYSKVTYVHPYKLHEYVPQPAIYAFNRPRYYTWFAGNLWWYPIPDAVYTMTTWYYAKPTQMQFTTTGTAVLATLALTGTNTVWLQTFNVPGTFIPTNPLYFAYAADVLSDGTYPWAQIDTITSNTGATLKAAYNGASSTGACIITSDSSFTPEFDPYLIYSTGILEVMRNREMSQMTQLLQTQVQAQLAGLIQNQTSLPDFIDGVQDFAREPILLGDDYAKFPFISGNP